MPKKSTLKQAAGRRAAQTNPAFIGRGQATKLAFADYMANKIPGCPHQPGQGAGTVMGKQEFKDRVTSYLPACIEKAREAIDAM